MGGEWKVGDDALCIKRGTWRGDRGHTSSTYGPAFGGKVTVRALTQGWHELGLRFEEYPGDDWISAFAARRFIKITPEAADEFDQEIISLMNTKPVPAEGV